MQRNFRNNFDSERMEKIAEDEYKLMAHLHAWCK
jgi:hypothetical protein